MLADQARRKADLSVRQLWLRYLALGGHADLFELDGYLSGAFPMTAGEEDMVAHAVNEALYDTYRAARVPYEADWEVEAPGEDAMDLIERLLADLRRDDEED